MNFKESYNIEVKNIVKINDTHMNNIFIADGKFVIKIYNQYICKNEIDSELLLYEVMQNMTIIKIPKIIKNKIGEFLSTDENGNYFTVSEFIDGYVTFEYTKTNLNSSAKSLAMLHSDIYKNCAMLTPINTKNSVSHCSDLIATIEIGCQEAGLDIKRIRENLNKTIEFHNSEACKSLLRFTIHGDFGGDNILFNHNTHEVAAIIDFAENRNDSPLYDLVMIYFFLNQDNNELAKHFIDTYIENLSIELKKKIELDKIHFKEIILSMFVYELYLMIIMRKYEEIPDAFEMVEQCLVRLQP